MTAARFDQRGIPQELRDLPRWVRFDLDPKPNGGFTKTPRIAGTDTNAASDNPATWRPFEDVRADAEARGQAVGFAFGPDLPYVVVDLDGVRSPHTGVLKAHAQLIADTLDSLTEVSVSGMGVHVFMRGTLPDYFTRPVVPEGEQAVEVYPQRGNRFIVMTGWLRPGLGSMDGQIEERTEALAHLFPPRAASQDRGASTYAGPSGRLSEDEAAAIVESARPLWLDGRKHHTSLYLAGWLGKQGVPREQAVAIVEALAAGDEKPAAKVRNVHDTYDNLDLGFTNAVGGYFGLRDVAGHSEGSLAPMGAILEAYWRRTHVPPVLEIEYHREGNDTMGDPAREDDGQADAGSGNAESGPRLHVVDPAAATGRPQIVISNRYMEKVTGEAWEALAAANNPPTLFQYAGLPSRIERDEKDGPFAQALTPDRLRYEAARAAGWYRARDVKDVGTRLIPANPPMDTIRDMLATRRQDIPLPVLDGITEAPVFGPDGSLPIGPGYHPEGRMFYAPARGFEVPPIPSSPTREDVEAARALLVDDLLYDFPFTGQAERANTVALLLLPFLRGLIDGPTPLHLIEKPTAGTGASLLADVVARLATGRAVGVMTEGRDEDEWRKRLTSTLRGGRQIVMIDNLRGRLDSAALAAALTASHHEDRILGTSDMIRLPVRCVWLATGNNPGLSSEITRRTVRIRLNAKTDRPWERDPGAFRHPALLQWVDANRGALVAACLTFGQAWIAAGMRPATNTPTLGSYEEWARVVGGVLEVAGVEGFLANKQEFYSQSDTEGAAIRAFLAGWWETHRNTAVGVADLFTIAAGDSSTLDLGAGSERSQRTRLGRLLGELRERRYDLEDGRTVCVMPGPVAHQAKTYQLIDETPPRTDPQRPNADGF